MSKRLILACAVVLLLGGLIGFFLATRGESSPLSLTKIADVGEEKIEGEEVYQDESGFSFKYPKGAKVTDITPEESDYYSMLEITYTKASGKLTVSIRDTKFTDVSKWARENLKDAQLAGAVSLGSIKANQYTYASGSQKQIKTVAIDKGIVYEITAPQDSGFWEETTSLLASSFLFGLERPADPQTDGQPVIYEEEEVVE